MNNSQTGALLKELRSEYNYTIEELARLLGVSKAAVSKWEKGRDISTEHLFALAKFYNVKFSELYAGIADKENDSSFWRRHYDLSKYEPKGELTYENINAFKEFYNHCNMVKKRFFELLPQWANGRLSENQIEEFNFIKKYFKFDAAFYRWKKNNICLSDDNQVEKAFIIETINNFKDPVEKKYQWEITKLYDFIFDRKSNVIARSGSNQALAALLSTFSQVEKDCYLYNLHTEKNKTVAEIEQLPNLKVILDSGANVLYKKEEKWNFEPELLEKFEGSPVEIDQSVFYKYPYNKYGREGDKYILRHWKEFSYDEYMGFVDKAGTDRLKDIVKLRNSNPIRYFEKMKEREYANAIQRDKE